MTTEIILYINPNPNFDATADEIEAVRDLALRLVSERFPDAEVDGEIKDALRSFSYWSEDGMGCPTRDEFVINDLINAAWNHVFQC